MSKTEALPVHIYFLLDRSGSMNNIANDVIGGFNAFVKEQQSQPGKCRLTLVQFDGNDPQEVIHDAVKIADVPALTHQTFIPRGNTPLLDAEGLLIAKAQGRETERKLAGKPAEAILFVTYTDGMENASREWSRAKLVEAKKAAEESGWAFSYLGVGHDAYGQSASVGTQRSATRSRAATSKGVASTYAGANYAASNFRSFANEGAVMDSSLLLAGFEEEEDVDAEVNASA